MEKFKLDYPWARPEIHNTAVIKTSEDPLVLSCTLNRLYQLKKYAFDFTSSDLPTQITNEDRELADKIRNHYRSKLVVAKIRGTTMSKFRTDVALFLSSDCKLFDNTYAFPSRFSGLIFRLPHFYKNDLILYDIFGSEYFEIKESDLALVGDRKLKFIQKIDTGIKTKPFVEYWFSDKNDNRVYLEIDKNNPLIPLFEGLLDKEISIVAAFKAGHRDNLNFFHATKWKLQLT